MMIFYWYGSQLAGLVTNKVQYKLQKYKNVQLQSQLYHRHIQWRQASNVMLNPEKIWPKMLQICPSHLSDVATLPWEIQKSHF